jgi:hypothetical protein
MRSGARTSLAGPRAVRRPSRRSRTSAEVASASVASWVATTVCTLRSLAAKLQADEQRVAGDAVECGKRLVEKKQTGRGREGPGQGDALRLAAGEIQRAAGGELGCADEVEHFIDARARAARSRLRRP